MTESLILSIESSCDDTSAAVLRGTTVLSNCTSTQPEHAKFGGVIPEVAGRAHQQNMLPVIDRALREAGVGFQDLNAIAVTQGPGLSGSLLVGLTYAKSLSLALGIPLFGIHHMQAHILAHFVNNTEDWPLFPFLNLTVSGGHTQLVLVHSPLQMEVLAETIDDAAGEAFDKAAKLLGLNYPGGPEIDKCAQLGDAKKYSFNHPQVKGGDYSFSGMKTSLLYFLRDQLKENPNFIEEERHHIAASYQEAIVTYLLKVAKKKLQELNVSTFTLAGGVSANTALRAQALLLGEELGIQVYIPKFEYCTDNAAMIGVVGYFQYQASMAALDMAACPRPRWKLN
ncbi:MAG: tRNA (adenosine(37)-N6)-threonylcarbamoyltransferase complex transferase subunit TsaD [Bacteroidota bacterium]|jgi:N6-L-threonylcarbamoyladenine synthase